MVTRAEAAQELLDRRNARRSLLSFTEYTHHGWQSGVHHRLICDALEKAERREIMNLLIEAPPRHSKSELASRRFPAWYIGRNPHAQLITVTYSKEYAVDFGADVRDIVRDPKYQNVFPGLTLNPDRKAASRWVTSNGGIYIAAGIDGGVTGRGADVLLIDDPVKNRASADSKKKREAAWKFYSSTAQTRMQPGGVKVLIMTRWHEDDLAGRAMQKGNWTILKLPAITNEHTDNEIALWPEWFPIEELRRKREEDISPRDWSALYQQEPRTEVGAYIKREWFRHRYTAEPERLRVYMSADFAVKEATGDSEEGSEPDYTEIGVFGICPKGDVYVLDWWSKQTNAAKWIEELLRLGRQWKPHAFFGEGGTIRRAIEPFLMRRMEETNTHLRIEWINPVHDKSTRGRSFQAMASMGRIHFGQQTFVTRVMDQVVGFPGAAFDDAFDVLSQMCMAIDQAHPAILPGSGTTQRRPADYGMQKSANNWKVA